MKNKRLAIEDICKELEIGLKQVIYIGDDINELESRKVVGIDVVFQMQLCRLKALQIIYPLVLAEMGL